MIFRRGGFVLILALFLVAFSSHAQIKPFRGAEYRTLASMTYGRFEVRMRSAQVSGMIASFFTFYDPANPWNEIDIENLGRYSTQSQFNTIVPTQADNHVWQQILSFNPHTAFHVYAIEWTPDYVAWQVDGIEVYRQTGSHIAQLTKPEKLMMNIWQSSDAGWAGAFSRLDLPVFAYYDWIKYYTYTPGVGDNFTLQWTDDLNSFDAVRWQKATHTWVGNNCQFVQENVVFQGGYMILCMTDSLHSGYSGAAIVDTDTDPPYLISARASLHEIRLLFSESLNKSTAETVGNYILPGTTITGATLLADGRTVSLAVSGLNPAGSYSLIALGVKDLAGNAMSAKSIKVIMPLPFPIRIDVGGAPGGGYLADSVWNFSSQYGAVGGRADQQPVTIDITGTTEDTVYRSSLVGLSSYRIRVPTDLTYTVSLMLVEPKYQAAGKRVFDVSVNGSSARRIDIYQQAGYNAALRSTFPAVGAPDGIITISFSAVADSSIVSGITIESTPNSIDEGEASGGGTEFGIFPNPFNGMTNLSFFLPRGEEVDLRVFDILGRQVSTIISGHVEGGWHSFRWNATDLASGAYVCSLRTEEGDSRKRLLLVK
jgi:hypothetical protein